MYDKQVEKEDDIYINLEDESTVFFNAKNKVDKLHQRKTNTINKRKN